MPNFAIQINTVRVHLIIIISILSFLICSCVHQPKRFSPPKSDSTKKLPDSAMAIWFKGENHLQNVRQLTFGGSNAEAYWSFDNKKICFQRSDNRQTKCDQIYWGYVPKDSSQKFLYKLESSGKGRTTCSAFLPG